MRQIHLCEVGPRDGLQNARHRMSTEAKKRWISALAEAGLEEIEVGSFVPPKVVPAMADTAEVAAHACTIPGLRVVALAPNVKGFERALAAGVHKVTFPVSASRRHSEANVRMTPEEMVAQVKTCVAMRGRNGPLIEAGISTAFGCTIQGEVPEEDVLRLAVALAEAGADGIALADTVGYADPARIRRLFRRVRAEIGEKLEAAHLHDTRGLGLANALAAYDEGVRHFDASLGGLGGCPFAPGAGGNVVTEDLVFMFEAMGLATGVDFAKLLAARRLLAETLPQEPLHGHIAAAGLPKDFRPAS